MSDLVKTTASITIKGIVKRVVAVWGIPGEAVDVAAAIVIKALTNPNDVAAQEAYKKLEEDIFLELAADSDRYKDKRPPSRDDVGHGLVRFAPNYKRAGSHEKRWMLVNALHNYYRPEFYNEGFAAILWPKLEALEYPDVWFLNRVLHALEGKELPGPEKPIKVTDKKYVTIQNTDLEFEFAKRLSQQGLLNLEDFISRIEGEGIRRMGGGGIVTASGHVSISPTGIASKFRDFVLEEFWKGDTAG